MTYHCTKVKLLLLYLLQKPFWNSTFELNRKRDREGGRMKRERGRRKGEGEREGEGEKGRGRGGREVRGEV
jgi:hypothetical protein